MACVGLEIGTDSGFSLAVPARVPRVPAAADSRHNVDDLAGSEGAGNETSFLGILIAEGDDIARGVATLHDFAFHNFRFGDGVGEGSEWEEEEGKGAGELHGFGVFFGLLGWSWKA